MQRQERKHVCSERDKNKNDVLYCTVLVSINFWQEKWWTVWGVGN